MLKVGLTGNIGSGKSLIAELFSIYGIPIYYADQEAKKFYDDPFVKEQIISLFGGRILDESGEISRKTLAKIVFTDEKALAKLDSIIHPMVIDDFENWCELKRESPYVIHEAAIIFESGNKAIFDSIIHVSCPREIAIERVIKRDGVDSNEVLQRMHFQMEDDEKAKLSDFVIQNDGSEMIIPQVLVIHEQLLKFDKQD